MTSIVAVSAGPLKACECLILDFPHFGKNIHKPLMAVDFRETKYFVHIKRSVWPTSSGSARTCVLAPNYKENVIEVHVAIYPMCIFRTFQ